MAKAVKAALFVAIAVFIPASKFKYIFTLLAMFYHYDTIVYPWIKYQTTTSTKKVENLLYNLIILWRK